MRKLLKAVFFVSCAGYFLSCSNKETTTGPTADLNKLNDEVVLETDLLAGELIIPKGAKAIKISESEVKFELPEAFKFLTLDESNNVTYSSSSSYSCTCSTPNTSCAVFYNEDIGFGCLQSSCTGSCTGKPKKNNQRVLGVVNTSSNSLLAESFIKSGHLTKEGYNIFFEKVVNEELTALFELAYKPTGFKNGEEYIKAKGENSTVQTMLQYLGITFTAVVPNFDEHKDSQLFNLRAGASVTCAGSNGCSCSKEKKCLFGNCVYYCDGCTTCTMTVDEK